MDIHLSGVHILLTYMCTSECDHCFVWGSPRQMGTVSLEGIEEILRQATAHGSVEWVYFEGGEPFLHYPILVRAVELAARSGFRVGLVTNAYWATDPQDAVEWLRPMQGVEDLSVSSDLFHHSEDLDRHVANAVAAAEQLGIPVGTISIARPTAGDSNGVVGQLPAGESAVQFRGRAASTLTATVPRKPWSVFDECPCEDLRDPGRVHIDPLGNVHICQGITLGNVFETDLATICRDYDPDCHSIVGALLDGGPAELVRRFDLPHETAFADACHLCYVARRALRDRFPDTLGPDQVYGVGLDD
jgi:MoaA/NifB/PqqE/SkfB family radical SAM enzyme